MIVKRMIIEGRFVEAFPYLDYTWLVGADGDVFAFDTQRFVAERLGEQAEAAGAVFARNDRLNQSETGAVRFDGQTPQVKAFCEGGDILVSRADVETYSTIFDTGLAAKSVLDMRCYCRRAFIATESRIVQLRLFGRDELRHMGVGLRGNGILGRTTAHDGRCLQFRSRYGVVSAACGGDGGFYARGAASGEEAWRADFRAFAPRSHATEFVGSKVANVVDLVGLELYDTSRAPLLPVGAPEDSENEEDKRIDRVKGRSPDSDGLNSSVQHIEGQQNLRFKRMFLTTNGAFAFDAENGTHNFRIAAVDGAVTASRRGTFESTPDDVIGLTTSPVGVVAELVGSVCVLSDGRWVTILAEPVYAVRGYPASRWYRQMLTIVGEEHTDVCFVSQ